MTGDHHVVGGDVRQAMLPGSHGEHVLQKLFDTGERADRFYGQQVLDHLNDRMREFIGRQEMAFVATADARGDCDATFRAGPAGFIRTLNDRTLAYPEYRGNGVLASLGNILENPHIAILMVDFFADLVGLHVNGRAEILTNGEMASRFPSGDANGSGVSNDSDAAKGAGGRAAERWVVVTVEEAYIHCSKNIPLLVMGDRRRRGAEQGVRPAGPGYFTGERAELR